MKQLLKRIWNAVKNVYAKIVDETRQMVPVAINVIEAVKEVMDTPVDDILAFVIKKSIPGTADDVLIDKISSVIKEWLPKILIELKVVQSIANIDDPNKQLQAIFDELKLSSDETKAIIYHGLATLILEKLSDGKLSWSDAGAIAEYYYQNVVKKSSK